MEPPTSSLLAEQSGWELLVDSVGSFGEPDDPFGQFEAARTLHLAVNLLPPGACVALYGGWGAGKTTILYHLFERWEPARRIWFDPWHHERGCDIIQPLLAKLERALPSGLDSREAGQSSGIQGARAGLSSRLSALIRGDSSRSHSEDVSVARNARALFRELVDAILSHTSGGDTRLLICLDDLDRCQPETVIRIIETVKLLMCGMNDVEQLEGALPPCRTVFVFALDRQIVGEAIQQRYAASSLYTGENYLEKVFDISIEAPPIRDIQMNRYIDRVLSPRSREAIESAFGCKGEINLIAGLSHVLCIMPFSNPRIVKRVINRLVLLVAEPHRIATLQSRINGDNVTRCLYWLAGVERFRSFRYFLRSASHDELNALDSAVWNVPSASVTKPVNPPMSIQGFANQPGFSVFARAVAPEGFEMTRRRHGVEFDILAFDDMMREAGL